MNEKLENDIISVLLSKPQLYYIHQDLITEQHFEAIENQKIFRAIVAVAKEQKTFDSITIYNWMRQNKLLQLIDGKLDISILSRGTGFANADLLEYWIRILHQEYIGRELKSIASRMHDELTSPNRDVLLISNKYYLEMEKKLISLFRKRSIPGLSTIVEKAIETEKEGETQGIPTGFKSIDDFLIGWHKSDLIIIAARPGVGKTAFALQTAYDAITKSKVGVYIASLEMKNTQLVQRMMGFILDIETTVFRKHSLTDTDKNRIRVVSNALKDKLIIDDNPEVSIEQLRSAIQRAKMKFDIGLIIVDYLQLMTGDESTPREQQVSKISRGLKLMAKDLDIPVIALSQMNRGSENRKDKKPNLSDLRESGAIEQDADQVLFLYRPDYHGFTHDAGGESTEGKVKLIIAKQRHGPLGEVDLRFDARYTKFYSPQSEFSINQIPEKNDSDDVAF